jgi:hypothetical protein
MRKYGIAKSGEFLGLTMVFGPTVGSLAVILYVLLSGRVSASNFALVVGVGMIVGYVVGFVPAMVSAVLCLNLARRRAITVVEAVTISAAVSVTFALVFFGASMSDQGVGSTIATAAFFALPGAIASLVIALVGRRIGTFVPVADV